MIGEKIIHLNTIDSTNNYLKKILHEGEVDEGTLVIAKEQTQGRGQRENKWECEKDKNLTFSFVIYPEKLNAADQFLLSKFVTLSLIDFLARFVQNIKIKWPNDIYVNKKKIAGILIENVIKGQWINESVIGIGMNINQIHFEKHLSAATSLSLETDKTYEPEDLLTSLLQNLNSRYRQINKNSHTELDRAYLDHLYQFNEFAFYQDQHKTFEAKIINVAKDGRLQLIDRNNQLIQFAFKEITFL